MALDRKGGMKSVYVDDEFAMKAGLLFAGMISHLAIDTQITWGLHR